jgi:hypothetical protein
MRELKDTRIEISGEGDVELLDYALSNLAVGNVERRFRLFNIKRWEHLQLSLTRKGKRRVWQPFRAQFSRSAAGTYTVTCHGTRFYAEEVIKQAGFTVVKVEPGTYPESGRAAGMKITSSVSLNGRRLDIVIDTSK